MKNVALFVGLFHASWYFKAPLASSAPKLHLTSYSQMHRVKEFLPDVASTVLKSMSGHLWYLTPQCVPLALVDEGLAPGERALLAVGLSKIPRPEVFPL